jgi:hypothetical protein
VRTAGTPGLDPAMFVRPSASAGVAKPPCARMPSRGSRRASPCPCTIYGGDRRILPVQATSRPGCTEPVSGFAEKILRSRPSDPAATDSVQALPQDDILGVRRSGNTLPGRPRRLRPRIRQAEPGERRGAHSVPEGIPGGRLRLPWIPHGDAAAGLAVGEPPCGSARSLPPFFTPWTGHGARCAGDRGAPISRHRQGPRRGWGGAARGQPAAGLEREGISRVTPCSANPPTANLTRWTTCHLASLCISLWYPINHLFLQGSKRHGAHSVEVCRAPVVPGGAVRGRSSTVPSWSRRL